jgi:hypothetical protein
MDRQGDHQVSKSGRFTDATESAGKIKKKRTMAKPARPAKRDDPEYKQALAYVRRDTHRRVMAKLAGMDKEFSHLVEELLRGWLAVYE